MISFRTLDYANTDEVRAYLRIFYAIPAELDEYYVAKSSEFIDKCVVAAQREENPDNTFSGIALADLEIVGVHILRRFEEHGGVGAHIAGLWVSERHRRQGVARKLKESGEAWARSIGASFLNTNVHATNAVMLRLNDQAGFTAYRINLRKRL